MIREAQRSELPAILELWLESTTWGHPFIKANYWRDCIPLVRNAYLANAQNWVWEEDGKLLGFVSIMEGRFLGGCGRFPGLLYHSSPHCWRYISGLTAPSDNFIRRSLYHLM